MLVPVAAVLWQKPCRREVLTRRGKGDDGFGHVSRAARGARRLHRAPGRDQQYCNDSGASFPHSWLFPLRFVAGNLPFGTPRLKQELRTPDLRSARAGLKNPRSLLKLKV